MRSSNWVLYSNESNSSMKTLNTKLFSIKKINLLSKRKRRKMKFHIEKKKKTTYNQAESNLQYHIFFIIPITIKFFQLCWQILKNKNKNIGWIKIFLWVNFEQKERKSEFSHLPNRILPNQTSIFFTWLEYKQVYGSPTAPNDQIYNFISTSNNNNNSNN